MLYVWRVYIPNPDEPEDETMGDEMIVITASTDVAEVNEFMFARGLWGEEERSDFLGLVNCVDYQLPYLTNYYSRQERRQHEARLATASYSYSNLPSNVHNVYHIEDLVLLYGCDVRDAVGAVSRHHGLEDVRVFFCNVSSEMIWATDAAEAAYEEMRLKWREIHPKGSL